MSKFHVSCLALLLCSPALGWARQSASPEGIAAQPEAVPAPQAPALTTRPAPAPAAAEGRMKLDVVVTDKSGRPVSGLELKDFTLLDNNQPSKILSFHAIDGIVQKANPPVEVILLIDTVNLPVFRVGFVRQEFEKFLRQNGGHLAQPVSIFWFTSEGVNVRRLPSTDGNALVAELNRADSNSLAISRSGREYDDIQHLALSVQGLTAIAQAEAKKPGRKLLIWAGHGWPMLDNRRVQASSKVQQNYFDSIVELSTKLREARISLYNTSFAEPGPATLLYGDFLKGVKSPEKAMPPNLALRVLATQSGGRVLGPDNDLAGQINSCVQDASAFYTLSFDPPRADRANEYHDLKVLIGKPGLVARTNTGYYNQP
jgi:VWFA-related protein